MASWNFVPKGNVWTGIGIGLAIMVAPAVIPMMAAAVRPLLKAGFKGGLIVYEKGRQTADTMKHAMAELT